MNIEEAKAFIEAKVKEDRNIRSNYEINLDNASKEIVRLENEMKSAKDPADYVRLKKELEDARETRDFIISKRRECDKGIITTEEAREVKEAINNEIDTLQVNYAPRLESLFDEVINLFDEYYEKAAPLENISKYTNALAGLKIVVSVNKVDRIGEAHGVNEILWNNFSRAYQAYNTDTARFKNA